MNWYLFSIPPCCKVHSQHILLLISSWVATDLLLLLERRHIDWPITICFGALKVVFYRGSLLAASPQIRGILILPGISCYKLYTWTLNCVQTIWDKNCGAMENILGNLGIYSYGLFFCPFSVSSSFQSLFINKFIAFGCEAKVDERL